MAIPTTRTKEKAQINIDLEKCTICGSCVSVCKDFSLILENDRIVVSDNPAFGCIGCGHCMAICPNEAIQISGREISSDDLFELPDPDDAANYKSLLALFQRRRSIREFLDKPVQPDIIEKILEAAKTSPMGLPPSDVNVLVLANRDLNKKFASDFCDLLKSMRWFVSGWFLGLMRPFWGKSNDEIFGEFVKPMFDIFINSMDGGENYVNYDAPLSMYFYGSPYTDPADPIVAATAAMYAGESLGLGTCMLGSVHPLIQYGKKGKDFRKKYGIKYKSREGVIVIFGYPAVKYRKGIIRTFASTTIMN